MLEKMLAAHPFFQGFDPKHIDYLGGCASEMSFVADAYLFREGEPAGQFFIVERGLIALETYAPQRGQLLIETLGEGEVVGWSWLFPLARWHFSGRAVRDMRVAVLDAACVRAQMEQDTAFGYVLMKRFSQVIAQRLQATRLQLLDVYKVGG